MVRWTALSVCCVLLSGCALPPSVRIASWAVDGLSYITTQKSVMDHGLSALSGQDCKVMRLTSAKSVCLDHAQGIDFNGDIAPQPDPRLAVSVQACDTTQISETLPDRARLDQCVRRLIDTFGSAGAVAHSDWRIRSLIDAGRTDDAGVWIGIQATVRDVLEAERG